VSDRKAHEVHRVASFEKLAAFTLRIEFADRSSQTIDFIPILQSELHGRCGTKTFRPGSIDPEVDTLVWPNGSTSIDPAILHNWPDSEQL
jgi:hypothetical protein